MIQIIPIIGLPEIKAGDPLPDMLATHLQGKVRLQLGDVLVVTQKIVSKAEDRFVDPSSITPSIEAITLAAEVLKAMKRDWFDAWAEIYQARLQNESGTDEERKVRMDRVNPKYILRNYLAQVAIDKAEKERDFSEVDRLLKLLGRPFDEQPEMADYAAPPPDWAQHISVSCSS